jgi:hypothetical protein
VFFDLNGTPVDQSEPGLPDGFFSETKKFWYISEDRGIENVVVMYTYILVLWNISRPLGIFYGHLVFFFILVYFSPLLVHCTKRNLATLDRAGILKS